MTISFRFNLHVAYALEVLAKAEDRSRTQIINRAIKHYLESYYPGTRKLEDQIQSIYISLTMWVAAVRSEFLWTDENARRDALDKLARATEEAIKLTLYRDLTVNGELRRHIYRLAAHLLEAKALELEDAIRPSILEVALKAEKEIRILRELISQKSAEGEAGEPKQKSDVSTSD